MPLSPIEELYNSVIKKEPLNWSYKGNINSVKGAGDAGCGIEITTETACRPETEERYFQRRYESQNSQKDFGGQNKFQRFYIPNSEELPVNQGSLVNIIV